MEIKKVNLSPAKAKKICEELFFYPVPDYDVLILKESHLERTQRTRLGSTMTLLDSDLHLDLNKLVDKQSFTQPGKYKRARVYLFDTPCTYISAVCETGDRGSSFFYCNKPDLTKSQDDQHLRDLENFFRTLFLNILKNNAAAYNNAVFVTPYKIIIDQLFKEEQILKNFEQLNAKIDQTHSEVKKSPKL